MGVAEQLSWSALARGCYEFYYVDSKRFLSRVAFRREMSSYWFILSLFLDVAEVADKSFH